MKKELVHIGMLINIVYNIVMVVVWSKSKSILTAPIEIPIANNNDEAIVFLFNRLDWIFLGVCESNLFSIIVEMPPHDR